MAKAIDYDERWLQAFTDACGGDPSYQLEQMDPNRLNFVFWEAFRSYLLECYCDQVKREFGPALTPGEDIGVLQLKAALVNQWKTSDLPSTDKRGIINALTGELSTFKLPEEAYEVVAYLEKGVPQAAFRGRFFTEMISEMVKHHRPDRLADQ